MERLTDFQSFFPALTSALIELNQAGIISPDYIAKLFDDETRREQIY